MLSNRLAVLGLVVALGGGCGMQELAAQSNQASAALEKEFGQKPMVNVKKMVATTGNKTIVSVQFPTPPEGNAQEIKAKVEEVVRAVVPDATHVNVAF